MREDLVSGKNQSSLHQLSSYKDTKKNNDRHLSVSKSKSVRVNAIGFLCKPLHKTKFIITHAFGVTSNSGDGIIGLYTAAISTAILVVRSVNAMLLYSIIPNYVTLTPNTMSNKLQVSI